MLLTYLLGIVFCLFVNAEKVILPGARRAPHKSFELVKPYTENGVLTRFYEFGGNTYLKVNEFIRLTDEQQGQSGWVFSRLPFPAHTSFEIEIEFLIHGPGGLHGDGMAIWLTPNRAQQGSIFGGPDVFTGVAILLDTYKNGRPGVSFPYIMAMVGDGRTRYDKDHDGKANDAGGCSARGLVNNGGVYDKPSKAKITYVDGEFLALDLMYRNQNEYENCFVVKNVRLPSSSYLGFTAETGDLFEAHDIMSVRMNVLQLPDARPSGPNAQRDKANAAARRNQFNKQTDTSNSAKSSVVKFFLVLICILICYGGFVAYRSNANRDRF